MNPEIVAKMLKALGFDVEALKADYQTYIGDFQKTMAHFDSQIKLLTESNTKMAEENAALRLQLDTRFDLLQSMIEDYQDGKRIAPGDGNSPRPN